MRPVVCTVEDFLIVYCIKNGEKNLDVNTKVVIWLMHPLICLIFLCNMKRVLLGRSRRKGEATIKTLLKEIGQKAMDC
jgi:hypothetical protein